MTNELNFLYERIGQIEKLSYKMNLDKAAEATRKMSTCDNLFAIQRYLDGLAAHLKAMESISTSIWNQAYDVHRDYERLKEKEEKGDAETV